MIAIKKDGEYADLLPDTRISLHLENPIFADGDIIPGSFSLPFPLPGGDVSGKNARIFGHPEVPENNQAQFTTKDMLLMHDGVSFRKGELKITEASARQYAGNFIFGMRVIADDFKSKSIRDMLDEEIIVTNSKVNKSVCVAPASGVTTPYRINVNGNTFEAATISELATAVNEDEDLTASFQSAGSGVTYGVSGDRILIEPALGRDDISTEFHVAVTADEWVWGSDAWVAYYQAIDAFLDGYYFEPYSKAYIRFPYCRNVYPNEVPESWNGSFGRAVNERNSVGYKFSDPNNPSDPKASEYHPFITLAYIFDTIAEMFGVTFRGSFIDDPYFEKALFFNTSSLAYYAPYVGEDNFMFYRSQFNIKDLVPDITIEQLIKGLQNKYNLAVYFDELTGSVVMNYRDTILKAVDYTDWTEFAGPVGKIQMKYSTGVRLTAEQDENDEGSEEDLYEIGDPDTEISSIFGALIKNYADSYLGMVGPAFSTEPWSAFTPRLIFYSGIIENTGITDFEYPAASYKGWEVRYEGTGALGETNWAAYIRWLRRRKVVKMNMRLPMRVLTSLDLERKVRIDGVPYFIKSINVTLNMWGVGSAEVELYTAYSHGQ